MRLARTLPPALLVASGLLAAALPAPSAAAVFVVRHAEKQTEENGKEVPLSEAGRARAARIAAMLRDCGVAAIYSTDTVRTLATAEPLARASGLHPVLYDTSGPDAMKTLAARILREHPADNVLVVGHSNTIGPLLQALGCAQTVSVAGPEYDGLWVVVPSTGDRRAPVLLRLRQ